GERRRRPGPDGGFGGADDVQGALERPDRRGARRADGGRLDPQSHLPAARVFRRGHGRVRVEGFDRDGGGRGARAHGGRDREGPRGGAQGNPGAAGRRERTGRRYAAAQNGMDQGRAPGRAGG